MIYDDGFPMDENLRVTQCPKCGNEQFSKNAEHCRICGTLLYNCCEGEDIYDYQENFGHTEAHKNHGNARFCEKCGKPTYFFQQKFLFPYDAVGDEYSEQFLNSNQAAIPLDTAISLAVSEEENDGLPF